FIGRKKSTAAYAGTGTEIRKPDAQAWAWRRQSDSGLRRSRNILRRTCLVDAEGDGAQGGFRSRWRVSEVAKGGTCFRGHGTVRISSPFYAEGGQLDSSNARSSS